MYHENIYLMIMESYAKIMRLSMMALCLLTSFSACRMRGMKHRELMPGIEESKVAYEQKQSTDGAAQPVTVNDDAEEPAEERQGDYFGAVKVAAPLADRAEQILHRVGYVASYNKDWRLPNWVGWILTADHTTGPYKRKGVSFQEDMEVPEPRVTTFDYQRSGYDRGHMCPSGDNKWSRKAQEDCFLMTNICPQTHTLNAGDWNDLEQQCRRWAQKYEDIYIVAGPIVRKESRKRIGRAKVVVPDAFFKVVLHTGAGAWGIGFVYENNDEHHSMSERATTIDEVEELTGINFFPTLAADLEKRVEGNKYLIE